MNGSEHRAVAARAEAARLELGVAAMTAERRNRPRILVVLAGLLTLAALIYAFSNFSARASALSELQKHRDRLAAIQRLGDEAQRFRESESERGLTPDPRVAAKLETYADAINFRRTGPISDSDAATAGAMKQKKYTARAVNQDPAVLLRWLEMAQKEINGLEIARLSIRPTAAPAIVPAPVRPPQPPSSDAADPKRSDPSKPDATKPDAPQPSADTQPPGAGYNVDIDFTRWEKIGGTS